MPAQPPPPAEAKVNWADVGFKVLSLLILPLLGIGVSMYTESSVMRERITQIQTQQTANNNQIEATNTRINQIALTVQETNGQVRELGTVLGIIRSQITGRQLGDRR